MDCALEWGALGEDNVLARLALKVGEGMEKGIL